MQRFFQRYNGMTASEQQSLSAPVLNKCTPLLATPTLRTFFGARQPTFSLRKRLDTPGSITLVSLGVDTYHEASSMIGSLLLAHIQQCFMERLDQPESERTQTHVYVDEFARLADDRLELLLTNGRRYGCGMTISTQNLVQLSTELRHIVRSNCYSQFFFSTSSVDAGELARELNLSRPLEEVRAAIMQQAPGECFLMRRAEPTVQIRLLPPLSNPASPDAVEALRQKSLQRFGRQRSEIEAEMLARESRIDDPGASPTRRSQSTQEAETDDPAPDPTPPIEVRRATRRAKKYKPNEEA